MSLPTKHATNNFKRGAASLYIVIFTALLLGLIVLSFTRIMVSDARQTSNQDLSQSAYDSALAGVEDAKVALLKYHDCISQENNSRTAECQKIIDNMQKGIADKSCDVVQKVLGRTVDEAKGVIIQEKQSGSDNSASLEQAYTCVTLAEKLADYRSFLNAENRVRVVPLRTAGSGHGIDDIRYVKFSWYSAENYNDNNRATNFPSDGGYFAMPAQNAHIKPPIVSVQLIQTGSTFALSELSASGSNTGTDRATMLFYPTTAGSDGGGTVSSQRLIDSNSKAFKNEPFKVNCNPNNGAFLCNVFIEIPPTFNKTDRNEGTSYIVATLPYGEPSTDFSVMLCTGTGSCTDDGTGTNPGGNVIEFTAVQTKVDSTGRANDLFRRVETRVELVDTYFPYPEFAIQMTGQGDESEINKSFWVSNNCWVAKNGGWAQESVVGAGSGPGSMGQDIAGCVDSARI